MASDASVQFFQPLRPPADGARLLSDSIPR